MSRKTVFDSMIAEPLDAVLGQTLLSVDYWILDCDKAGFSAEQPNATGVMAVRLCFEETHLRVAPGREETLRADGIYHHIQLHLDGECGDGGDVWTEKFAEAANIQAALWQRAVGKRLTHVEALGFYDSPQAIRFSFSAAAIVVATGYSGNPLLVGDGDEILVFAGQEWPDRSNTHEQAWERLWSASATVSREVLVN